MTHRPRKRFGQNFLQDPQIIFQIAEAINPRKNQHLVEIGPGKGALTNELVEHVGVLDLIELDRDLVEILKKKYEGNKSVRIHSGDALKFDFGCLYSSRNKLRVVGNLPYNISTPLLFSVLKYAEIVEDMHFMLQKEVVDRICSQPGSKQYGKLSVLMQYRCRTEKLFDVAPECFKPSPKVHSSLIRLKPLATPSVEVADLKVFEFVVTQAFSQRRKTLRNTLKNLISEEQLKAMGIDPKARAETLSLEAFALLSHRIGQQNVLFSNSNDDRANIRRSKTNPVKT